MSKRIPILAMAGLLAAAASLPVRAEPPATQATAEDLAQRKTLATEVSALMNYEPSIEDWKKTLIASQNFSQCGCAVPEDMRAKLNEAWAKAVSEEFKAREVLSNLEFALATELTTGELRQAIAFRKSPLGLKMAAAEEANRISRSNEDPAVELARLTKLGRKLDAMPARKAQLQRIVKLVGGSANLAETMITLSIGTALGATAVASDDQPRMSHGEIVSMIEAARPQMEQAFEPMMVPMYGSLYERLTDKELKALADELDKPQSRKFVAVSNEAFKTGLRAQALKMGQRFGHEMKAEKI